MSDTPTTQVTTRATRGRSVTSGRTRVAPQGAFGGNTGAPLASPLTLVPPPVTANPPAGGGTVDDELEASIARHPASHTNPWVDLDISSIQHLPLPDVIGILTAAGLELRMQTRRSTH